VRLRFRRLVQFRVERPVIALGIEFDVVAGIQTSVTLTLDKNALLYAAMKDLNCCWINGRRKSCCRQICLSKPVDPFPGYRNLIIGLPELNPFVT
jgi:hypothetical protein